MQGQPVATGTTWAWHGSTAVMHASAFHASVVTCDFCKCHAAAACREPPGQKAPAVEVRHRHAPAPSASDTGACSRDESSHARLLTAMRTVGCCQKTACTSRQVAGTRTWSPLPLNSLAQTAGPMPGSTSCWLTAWEVAMTSLPPRSRTSASAAGGAKAVVCASVARSRGCRQRAEGTEPPGCQRKVTAASTSCARSDVRCSGSDLERQDRSRWRWCCPARGDLAGARGNANMRTKQHTAMLCHSQCTPGRAHGAVQTDCVAAVPVDVVGNAHELHAPAVQRAPHTAPRMLSLMCSRDAARTLRAAACPAMGAGHSCATAARSNQIGR